MIGNYKPSQALIYLLISIFILIGISGLKKLFNVLEEQNEKLEKISKVDHLTGVFNRLEIESRITQEIKRSQRTNDPIAFLLLDIDHFKNINDTYGHPVGDKVLKSLTKFCVSELRVIDVLGRVGGEEFLIMLPNTDESEAYRVAERIRSGVAELICDQVNHEPVHIQVSIGISIYDPAEEFNNLLGEAPHQTMKKYSRRADLAMYQAKQAGRNQTKCWRE